ncbi:MAG: D-alanine--D-alanine ligase [bacterium]
MKIGITYDLREQYLALGYGEEETAEFDQPQTIQAIQETLQELGHFVKSIGNAQSLMAHLLAGERWDLVFNIAEGLRGFGREALVPALLEAYDIPYTFSDPLVLTVTLHKPTAKRLVRDLGLPTPEFCVVESAEEIGSVQLPYPLFLKPVAEGTGKGITESSCVGSPQELQREALRLLTRFSQPVLVESFLPGREFTVGILGTGKNARVLGVMEVVLLEGAEVGAYSYKNKEQCERFVQYRKAEGAKACEAADLALCAWRGLGCRDAGRVDLREGPDGRIQFLEVNPLAGLHPHHSDLPILCKMHDISYKELIGAIVESALSRTHISS